MPEMRHLVLGTAGHIDHGKTALVRALTGTDTDRLPEEKRRGITIDIGFARLALENAEYAVVDVPGHESLVRNMLAGATGIDVVLLVVAADEGVMPQTREHLAIMQLLGVRNAVVALTKADLVDADWLELAADDVRHTLRLSSFGDAPVVAVSATTGDGLARLRTELEGAADRCPARVADDVFRLPIDRVFTIRGTGTVVTGTIWSGSTQAEALLVGQPGHVKVRVRGLQRHGQQVSAAAAGERVALAVAADRERLERGTTLVSASDWIAGFVLTALTTLLPDAGPLRRRQRVRLHLGTAEVLGRVVPLEHEELQPGTASLAQFRLEAPLLARTGDRFVLRAYSPVRTIGGGVVLEPDAKKRKRTSPEARRQLRQVLVPDLAVAAAVGLRGSAGLPLALLPFATGLPPVTALQLALAARDVVTAGDTLYPSLPVHSARQRLLAAVHNAHRQHPMKAGLPLAEARLAAGDIPRPLFEHITRELIAGGNLVTAGGCFALPDFSPAIPAHLQPLATGLAAAFTAAGLMPPRLDELPSTLRDHPERDAVLRLLVEQGSLVSLGHEHFADAAAVHAAARSLAAAFPEPAAVTTGMLKEQLSLPRKHLIPLLEYFDRVGVTRREGDMRSVVG